MDLLESYTHSFVIKIWLEETAEEAGKVVWRGHIDHVPSGRRGTFGDLDGVSLFILPYLEAMGAEPPWRWRLLRWLKQQNDKVYLGNL